MLNMEKNFIFNLKVQILESFSKIGQSRKVHFEKIFRFQYFLISGRQGGIFQKSSKIMNLITIKLRGSSESEITRHGSHDLFSIIPGLIEISRSCSQSHGRPLSPKGPSSSGRPRRGHKWTRLTFKPCLWIVLILKPIESILNRLLAKDKKATYIYL